MRSIIILLSLLLLMRCHGKVKSEFQPPQDIQLNSSLIYTPLHIWRITEHPSRFGCMWNDSLINLLDIRRVVICCKGGERPDATSEKLVYEFDSKGQFTRFEYFNEELGGETLLSVIRRVKKSNDYLRIDIDKFYGVDSKDWIERKEMRDQTIFVRHRPEALEDTISVTEFGNIAVRMEKIGKNISGVRLVLPKNIPLSRAVARLHAMGISDEELNYANKIVTYTDTDHNLPIVTYELSHDWAQKEKIEEWEYRDFKVVERYEKFVNRTSVKKVTFSYSNDLILRSLVSNGRTYRISYQ